jgi:NAD+ synthase
VLQLEQALPPIGVVAPLSSLETEQKVESTRLAVFLQRGQATPSSALLKGRNSSNFISHSGHKYSYIGIFCTSLVLVYSFAEIESSHSGHISSASLTPGVKGSILPATEIEKVSMDAEPLAEKLVLWIRDQVLSADLKGVVVGMSGGLDSSVLAALCQRAFPESTLGVIMPCYSSPEDEEHARIVADQFSITTKTVVLDSVFDTLLKVLSGDRVDPDVSRLTESNLKARLRMLNLYYFANQLTYMVAGSSNRCELSVGYFTKYGDSGVDIMPLGNLVKGQVRELARFLGIPPSIIDKPPSAGLWPGQTDEGELGLSYEELDRYLVTCQAPEVLKDRIDSMVAVSAHKRQPPPVADC